MKGYDYTSAGAYFVTICTQERACLFGDVADGQVRLNDAGKMVERVWSELTGHYPGVELDEFIVMPNHMHGIIVLVGAGPRACPDQMGLHTPTGQPRGVAPTMSLPDVVHRFKTLTTKLYADGVHQSHWPPFAGRLWQRNYHEHIIRDEADLARIRRYITDNPARWTEDPDNPQSVAAPRGRPSYTASSRGRPAQPTR